MPSTIRNPLPPTTPLGEPTVADDSADDSRSTGPTLAPRKESTSTQAATQKSAKIDAMLPPEATGFSGVDYRRPLPLPDATVTSAAIGPGGVRPTGGDSLNNSFQIRKDFSNDEDDSNHRTAEQRVQIRFMKNVLLFLAGLIILIVTLMLLRSTEPVFGQKLGTRSEVATQGENLFRVEYSIVRLE